jgi:uncharacterized damage-inducible protein DinB
MLLREVAAIFDRDLRALARELESYPDERDLWRRPPGVANSAGTLALHLTGNVQHYLGSVFGGTGYRRDRAAEFSDEVPRVELLRRVEAARAAVQAAASRTGDTELAGDFAEVVGGVRVAAGEYLIHLATHFAYHLGQLDYHRRIVTGDGRGVDAVRAAELGTARPVAD